MNSQLARGVVIAVAILFPSLVTWVYFDLLQESRWKMVAYPLGKGLQFMLPLVWVCVCLRQRVKHAGLAASDTLRSWSTLRSAVVGIAAGIAIVALMYGVLRWIPAPILAPLKREVAARVSGFAVDSAAKFAALAMFYAVVHSFLEEYYFRWFVFGQLRLMTSQATALVLSALAFMTHHVIVLNHYFPGHLGWTAFLSFSIFVGGLMWAYQYEKSKSLVGPWLSHALVDAGIFAIGYQMLYSN